MTDVRDVGDGYPIRYEARNPDTSALVNATVTLTITDTSGGTTAPSPVNTVTGIYDYTIPLTSAGVWFWRWDVSGTVADRAYGSVLASDPAPPTYASLADLKELLKIGSSDTSDDAELGRRLISATRRIERDCGRSFWLRDVSTRVYRAMHPTLLPVDDIATSTGLLVDTGRGPSAWTALDVSGLDTWPENAEAGGKAIEMLVQSGRGVWPLYGSARVRVTARWGWLAVPEDISNACLISAARLFRRKDSLDGVVGNSDYGPIRVSKYDADYDNLIHAYVKVKP